MNKIVLDVDVIDKCSIRRLRVILLPIGEKYYIQAHFCKVYANYLKLNGTEWIVEKKLINHGHSYKCISF